MRSSTVERRFHLLDVVLRLPLMVFALSCLYAHTESETSYTWKLDLDVGKVMPGHYLTPLAANAATNSELNNGSQENNLSSNDFEDDQELMLDILMSTVAVDGTWKKTWRDDSSRRCGLTTCANVAPVTNNRGQPISSAANDADEVLDCGKPVNFTYYDHLVGIQNRDSHPHIPEPDVVSLHFGGKRWSKKNGEINVDAIERRLKRSKRDKPKSVELYNQIGNFWRVKGDTQKSIECFRRALAVSPNNAEVLLNLARVLFNLQYLDDAIFLTRRSLEVQPPDQNAWQQHFQLGEILKAYCHYQEAALHLRHVLELKPNYGPALQALQDMDSIPDTSVHVYTLVIIVILVLAVIVWIVTSWEGLIGGDSGSSSSGESSFSGGKLNRLKFRNNGKR